VKLRRLDIRRLPGIDEPFALEDLGDQLQVIVGPNGIGKSSLCRAARALLWSDRGPEEYMEASALFEREGERWRVEREGSRHRWQRDGVDSDAPPLPASHLDGCFFPVLSDLLDPSSEAGSDLAGEIRRQMSGGFDLEKAASSLFAAFTSRTGRKEQSDLAQAERELRHASSRQGEIARDEDRLAGLERKAGEAGSAQHRLVHFENALEVHHLRAELAQVEEDLAALPAALERLGGDELSQLEQRERELEEKGKQRREAETALEAALKARAETRLQKPLDPAAPTTWRERADKLADLETRRDHANEDWKGRQRAVEEASRSLGGREEAPAELDLERSGDLFAFLREAQQVEQQRQAIEARLRLLEGRSFSDEHRQRLELLREGVGPLRAWLRVPDPEAGRGGTARGRRWLAFGTSAVLVAAGAALGFLFHPAFALLSSLGLGLAAAGLWLLRSDPDARYAHEASMREFPTALGPLASWTRDGVAERLRSLEGELAALEAAAQRARDREVERADLENQRSALEERQAALERQRRELASRLGLEEIPANAELVDTARALDQLRRAREAEVGAEARARQIAEEYHTLLSQISEWLTTYGENEPTDAASARAGVGDLADRDHALRSARDREQSSRRALRQLDEDIDGIVGIMGEIYRRPGLEAGDRVGLQRLLEQREPYLKLRTDRTVLEKRIRTAEEGLAQAGELELSQRDRGKLELEKATLEEQAGGADELRGQISDIRAEVRRAREGHDLEDALASRDGALGRLEECQREAMRAAAGRFLLDSVKREHETNQMPRVLERARELFGTFTHRAYELRVAPDAEGSFLAIEARSGAGRRPQELSDGTRTQLLLAARLAFAEESEQGARLPLFLDEALDQSDPERFRAIARSLGRMVEDEERQIFYLTNDPTDARRIQRALDEEGCGSARIIDLAAVRKRAASVPGPEALRVEPLPEVPGPCGQTPESYGAALGVPPLDPRRGHRDQHLLHLLWDDLSLLHRLVESRIERVGQWLTLGSTGGELARRNAAEGGAGSQLDARAELLEAFCRAWREGRGRPVERDAVERSGAITDRYLDHVVEITRELQGCGERLIQALRARDDDRLQGFRSKAADGLEAFLSEEGFIDPRPILEESELVARVLAVPAAGRLPERVAAECLHRWWSLCGGPTTRHPG
jgi:DNA repair exonuclease SbcCD ATPase subunit